MWKFQIDSCLYINHLHNLFLLCLVLAAAAHPSSGLWWVSLSVFWVENPPLREERNSAHALTCLLTSVHTHCWRWVNKDAVNKDNSLTSTCVLQRLKLPLLTTRWHSCIESRREQDYQTKDEAGSQMFDCVCIVDSWSHYQLCYIMH